MSFQNINRILLRSLVTHQNVTPIRMYGRWVHRKPVNISLPFEPNEKVGLKTEKIITLDSNILNKSKDKPSTGSEHVIEDSEEKNSKLAPEVSRKVKQKRDDKLKKRNFYLSQTKVFDDQNEIIYEKLKDNDPRISPLLVKLKSKKERLNTRQVLVEGWRMIADGLQAKCRLKYIIFSHISDLNNIRPFLPKTGVKIYKIPYKEIELWSDVTTSPGLFGVFEIPEPESIKQQSAPLPVQFICDNIRVPGNLGAILRAAVGVGCEKVLLSKGCVDLWDPKVIRSGAGAHFRLPIHHSIDWDDMPNHLPEHTSVFIADSNANVDHDEAIEKAFEGSQIPVLPYYSVEYQSLKNITLILGGETEGISEESYRLTQSRNGFRINIPLQKGVDSLNTGMATAVIAFEIRKQLLLAQTRQKQETRSLN